MADFAQNVSIATLQNLTNVDEKYLEGKLLNNGGVNGGIALILPALYSEFEKPAINIIIQELKKSKIINNILLSLDNATQEQFQYVKSEMQKTQKDVKVIWNDNPKLIEMKNKLIAMDFPLDVKGKGRVVWTALGYALYGISNVKVIASHDCDIVNYNMSIPTRLIYPVANDKFNYQFNKGYYPRYDDVLFGRVERLFYVPLIIALKTLIGHNNQLLQYLGSFRYSLSGEFAITPNIAKKLTLSPDWGLEVSMLCDTYRKVGMNNICQTEIAENYKHKHNSIEPNNYNVGLLRMAKEIAKTLFKNLEQDGIIISDSFIKALIKTYIKVTTNKIDVYEALCSMNGLHYSKYSELNYVGMFSHALKLAYEEPNNTKSMPQWDLVDEIIPKFTNDLIEIVELDNII